jgi:hypothetical protein
MMSSLWLLSTTGTSKKHPPICHVCATEEAEAPQLESPSRLQPELSLPPSRYQHDIDSMVHTAQLGVPPADHGNSLLASEQMQHSSPRLPFEGHCAAEQPPLAPLSLHNGTGTGGFPPHRQLSDRTGGFPYSTLPALRSCSNDGLCSAAAVPQLPAATPVAATSSHGAGLRLSRAPRSSEDDDPSWQPTPRGATESSVTEDDELYTPVRGKPASAARRKPRPLTVSKVGKHAAAGDVRTTRTGGSSKYRGQQRRLSCKHPDIHANGYIA